MNDIWICDTCKSINRRRDDHCYRCRAPRSGAMETPGLDLRAGNAALERSTRSYIASWPIALITVVLLVGVAALGLAILKVSADAFADQKRAFLEAVASGHPPADSANVAQAVQMGLLALLQGGLMLLAVLTFAGWLALVTRNVPLLGGGTPSRSPARTFFYTLIPIWNLFKVPGMVQDLMYRVDPEGGGAFMVIAAVVGIVGSWVLNWLGGWVIAIVMVQNLVAATDEMALLGAFSGALDQSLWLRVVVEILAAAGTILLAVIMIRMELRCTARDREIRVQAAAAGTPASSAGPTRQTPGPSPAEAEATPIPTAAWRARIDPAQYYHSPSMPSPSAAPPSTPPRPQPASQPPGPPPPPPGAPTLG